MIAGQDEEARERFWEKYGVDGRGRVVEREREMDGVTLRGESVDGGLGMEKEKGKEGKGVRWSVREVLGE